MSSTVIKTVEGEVLYMLKSWNEWREATYRETVEAAVKMDFALHDGDFACMDLCKAKLAGAQIERGDFHLCTLTGANLRQANLRGADFQNAGASEVNFRGANLRDADFRGARLYDADFRGADLRGAKFEDAQLRGALFDDDASDRVA